MRLRAEPHRKYWHVKNAGVMMPLKPNRIAAGMSYTATRSGHRYVSKGPINSPAHQKMRLMFRLRTYGTMDALAGGIHARYKIKAHTVYRLARNAK
jgi:hypothetical protein